MKKITILFILSLTLFVGYSQTKIYTGPEIGFGVNRIRYTGGGYGISYSDVLPHAIVGIPFEFRFNDYIAIKTGLQYAIRGGKDKDYDEKVVTNNIEIPMLVKAGYGKNNKWQVYGITGFKLGVGVRAYYSNPYYRKYELDYGSDDGDLKRGYFGVVMGAGFSYVLGPGRLAFDIENDIAMTRMVRGNFALNGDQTQRQWANNFKLSYLFQIGGKKASE